MEPRYGESRRDFPVNGIDAVAIVFYERAKKFNWEQIYGTPNSFFALAEHMRVDHGVDLKHMCRIPHVLLFGAMIFNYIAN